MQTEVVDFLKNHRVSVLGILQLDNTIHSAALHFAFSESPMRFYFITEKTSRKCRPLLSGETATASLVIGFDEDEFQTFQAEGTVRLITNEPEFGQGWEIYGAKFANRTGQRVNPDMAFLAFQPKWWQYQDLKAMPKITLSSGDITTE